MTKKYAVLRTKTPQPGGGFTEALELGLVELSCLGDQYFDASGYPYPDEVHAFVQDWLNLGDDFRLAIQKMDNLARQQNALSAGASRHVKKPKEGPVRAPETTTK